MTQEQKQLLIKDLCGRLPYGVNILHVKEEIIGILHTLDFHMGNNAEGKQELMCTMPFFCKDNGPIEEFRPYLYPLSSMTNEQRKEFYEAIRPVIIEGFKEDGTLDYDKDNEDRPVTQKLVAPNSVEADWLNAHHFDYRGLIEQGLAIDATGIIMYDKEVQS